MDTVGLGFHLEDMPVGRTFRTIGRTITEPDIVNFISTTGLLEVMFTNMEFQKDRSEMNGRLAPGWLVLTICEGLLVQATMQHTALAFLNMEFNVHKAAFAGDTVHVEVEVIESRRSKSNPERGLVRTRNTVKNQKGEVLQVYTPLRMIKARETTD